jgi:L-ascorbate metabolism protein UlaG (beta-lactamase superfamily)
MLRTSNTVERYMFGWWKNKPFVVTKLDQLLQLVRESHAQPITGNPQPVEIVNENELGVTFIGHSSFMLQINGKNLLVDPVLTKRLVVLRRQRRPGLRLKDMPPIDLVLVTHAHMDHLSPVSLRRVVQATRRLTGRTPEVVVPWGVADLVNGVGFSQVHEMKWWQKLAIQGLQVTMTPSQHWGARLFRDTHRGYGGYVIEGGGQSVYHSGDTAYFSGFAEIGRRLQPQVALLPIGAYYPDSYRAVHTSPEEALRGFVETGAKHMVPMHFGTFRLGREPMDEPPVRLMAEAQRLGIERSVRVLQEGKTLRVKANRFELAGI